MRVVVLQLVQLLFAVGIVGSFVWALLPRGASRAARTRHRAEWLSIGFGLLGTYLAIVVVRALVRPDGPNPLGLVPFLLLAALVPLAVVVLRAAWRRSRAEATLEHGPTASPEPLEIRHHRGLSGEDRPPTRW